MCRQSCPQIILIYRMGFHVKGYCWLLLSMYITSPIFSTFGKRLKQITLNISRGLKQVHSQNLRFESFPILKRKKISDRFLGILGLIIQLTLLLSLYKVIGSVCVCVFVSVCSVAFRWTDMIILYNVASHRTLEILNHR